MKNNFLKILKGSLISIIISFAVLLITALILRYTNIPENVITIIIMVVSAISIMIGSIFATRKLNKNGLLNGTLVGITYFIILYILSSIFVTGFSINAKTMITLFLTILFGMIGGIIGINL